MGKLTPPQIVILGFAAFIAAGTGLLLLPQATVSGISPEDALFTSTSAVCVTGLIVKNTPVDFTFFGQVVIMLLIQVGGLGYMTSATLLFLMIGKRIGISERMVMQQERSVENVEGIVRYIKVILLMVLVFETAGALLLAARFLQQEPAGRALFLGVFHSISAFNNAGFSLFEDNLMRFRGDVVVNLVITTLIIVGGIGFLVISELVEYLRGRAYKLSVHTKIVLSTTATLVVLGAVLFFVFEIGNPATFKAMTFREQVLASYFGSVTARTAGFNTVDYSLLKFETLLVCMLFMFIGASPGSTGGGVKTTTFAVMIASLCALMRGRYDTVLFRRRMPIDTISKSFLSVTLAVLLIIVVTTLVLHFEEAAYLSAIFEVTSAFGTVGLSVGDGGVRSLSALFSPVGKVLISATMFAGRLGPLTLAIAIAQRQKGKYRYAEGKVIIG